MAEDRFVSEVVSKVAPIVIHALRAEGLAMNGDRVHKSNGIVRIAPMLLRVEDVAIMLARTKKSVRHLIHRGELRVVRNGRSVRVLIDDVLEFISRGRT